MIKGSVTNSSTIYCSINISTDHRFVSNYVLLYTIGITKFRILETIAMLCIIIIILI